jgi:Transposase DDE domain group 1
MGEGKKPLFEPTFNRAVKVRGGQDRLTSDAGTLLLREADHRLDLTQSLAAALTDRRDPSLVRYTFTELLRERLYALAQGYDAQDDVDELAHDPAMRLAVWNRPGKRVQDERLASQPTQSRLLAALGSYKPNIERLRETLADWSARHLRATGNDHAARRITIDIDSFPIQAYGQQAGAKYNGYYEEEVFHPLVASYTVGGDYDGFQQGLRLGQGFIHAVLRAGNVHTANGAKRFFRQAVRKARQLGYTAELRFDAGFAEGPILDFATDEKIPFLARLKANSRLQDLAAPHLRRPVGRPPKGGREVLVELGTYQAESWRYPQRVILVIVDCPDPKTGQLFLEPDYFFLVTSYSAEERPAEERLEHYRRRGTFEDRLGEFREAIDPKLSSQEFASNEATLLLSLLAFNLANMLRCELEDGAGACWDLGRFQKSVLKAGGRIVQKAGRVIVDLAAAVVPFWARLVARLERWRLPKRFPAPKVPTYQAFFPPPPHAFLKRVIRE